MLTNFDTTPNSGGIPAKFGQPFSFSPSLFSLQTSEKTLVTISANIHIAFHF